MIPTKNLYESDFDYSDDYSGIPLWSNIKGGEYFQKEFKIGEDYTEIGNSSGIFRCNSVDSRSDSSDYYMFYYDEYHIKIISNLNFSLYGDIITGQQFPDLIEDFSTEKELSLNGSSHLQVTVSGPRIWTYDDFIAWSLNRSNDFYSKYHLAWVKVENGTNNESSKILDDLLNEAGDPEECGQYSLFGAIEGRIRVTSLSLVFASIFCLGCMIHRFYIISGGHGTTNLQTLSRTFFLSQWGSLLIFSTFVAIFDPFDGSGISGITVQEIVNSGDSIIRIMIIGIILLMSLVVIVAMYRQRSIIGDFVEATKMGNERRKDKKETRRLLDEF